METMRYKPSDKVRIKSLDWYNENKDETGRIRFKYENFIPEMSQYCGEILTIKQVEEESECYLVSECGFAWTDEMIEGLVEEEIKPKFKIGDKIKLKSKLLNDIFGVIGYESEGYRITNISNGLTYFISYSIEHYYELVEEEVGLVDNLSSRWVNEFNLPEGYIFKDENGNVINAMKIVLEKKKKEYPKFKVGDRIKRKGDIRLTTIKDIKDNYYIITIPDFFGNAYITDKLLFSNQNEYELFPNKFDITNLRPFDKVLVRGDVGQKWTLDFFGFMDKDKGYPFVCVGHYIIQCIPYEGNECLLGTTNDCDDFYKTWK